MLGWLSGIIRKGVHLLGEGAGDLGSLALQGITAVVSFIFGDVGSAWDDMVTAWHYLQQVGSALDGHVVAALIRLITYDIPHYAMQAFWWVTHPAQLAETLGWHLVRFLEDNAWTAAGYLGKFILALILRNAGRVARLAEDIITAIL
jgi:hypothetical protein